MPLKRDISLAEATFYGIGSILGAGIYALIGTAAGMSGNALWLGFIIAGLIAALTAFSYRKLTARFPKEAAESVYVLKAFRSRRLAFFVGFVSLAACIISIATVALGFATYFKLFVDINPIIVAIGAIILFAIVNFFGIDRSVKVTTFLTTCAAVGLVLIIVFGLRFVGSVDLTLGAVLPNGSIATGLALIPGIFSAAAIIFFAYLGFEEVANITEEMESPKRNAPKAILISLCITTVIYVLIALVSVSVIAPTQLALATEPGTALTQGPLALVADRAIAPGAGVLISFFALFATASTMIALLIVSSRLLYGLSKEKLLPKFLSRVYPRTGTPHYAIAVSTAISIGFVLIGEIAILGKLTTLGTFLLFFMVNAALIALTLKEKSFKNAHLHWIRRLPILPLLGAVFCLGMFLTQYWDIVDPAVPVPLIIFGLIIFSLSLPIYSYFNKHKTVEVKAKRWGARRVVK